MRARYCLCAGFMAGSLIGVSSRRLEAQGGVTRFVAERATAHTFVKGSGGATSRFRSDARSADGSSLCKGRRRDTQGRRRTARARRGAASCRELSEARAALGDGATSGELVAGASALHAGVASDLIARLSRTMKERATRAGS